MQERYSKQLKNLNNFSVEISPISVKNYPELELNTQALVLHTKKGLEVSQTLLNSNVPMAAKVWDNKEWKPEEDPYFKVSPHHIEEQLFSYVYKGAPTWRPVTISRDYLYNGSRFVVSWGGRRKKVNPPQALHTEVLSSGISIEFFRTVGYRYDIMRNDYWMELKISAIGLGIVGHIFIPIPFPEWSETSEEKKHKFWEKYFLNLMESWKKPQTDKLPSMIRNITYILLCGGRRDVDFTVGTKKYDRYMRMKQILQYTERELGNNSLSVWVGAMLWLIEGADPESLAANLYGNHAEKVDKYNSTYFDFIEHGWPLA